MTQPLLITAAAVLNVAGMGSLLFMLPRVTRRDLFFAVTVSPEFRETSEARAIATRYRRRIATHALLWLAALAASAFAASRMPAREGTALAVAGLVLSSAGLFIGALTAFLSARRSALPSSVKPTPVREAALTRSPPLIDAPMAWLMAGPLILVLLTALACWAFPDFIPLRDSSHRGIGGTVDGRTARIPLAVATPVLIALPGLVFLLVMSVLVPSRARRLYASPEAAGHEFQARRLTLKLLAGVGYCIAVPMCIATLVLSFAHGSPNLPALLIAMTLAGEFVMLALLLVSMTRIGDRMEKARRSAEAAGSGVVGDRTDDRFWKWGMIYYNPADPAVWVEKRFGVGWTTNMARWQSWAWVAGFILLPGLAVFLTAVL